MLVYSQEQASVKIGQEFGKLTVEGAEFKTVSLYPKRAISRREVVVSCKCGCWRCVVSSNLLRGFSLSCGCRKTVHNKSRHPLYRTWQAMCRRCSKNASKKEFRTYGSRGISVCHEWADSFNEFFNWGITHGWQDGLQIDRIDNDAGYFPSNCRFVTRSNNCRNKRRNQHLEAFGERKMIIEWSEDSRCAVSYETLRRRATNPRFTSESAVTMPSRIKKRRGGA